MFDRFRHILEMIRFSHTVFAMPFALLATIMAYQAPIGDGQPLPFSWWPIVGVVLCMVLARSAAMAFNRLVDHRIDAKNPRTASRHIPAGILSASSVAMFTLACSVGFVAATLLFLPNWLPLVLSVPVLLFLFGYSYTKRWTWLAHFWLGVSLMLAPISAWIALRGEYLLTNPADILPAVVLGAGVMLWVAGFDIIYACQDADFDREAKLHSVPTRFGVVGALRIAAVCHGLTVLLLLSLPLVYPQLGWIYYAGIALVGILLCYQHVLVRADDLSRVNLAFFHVNTVIGVGVLVISAIDLWVGT